MIAPICIADGRRPDWRRSGFLLVSAGVVAATALAGCSVSGLGASGASSGLPHPRSASYRCTNGLTINASTTPQGIHVTTSRGETLDLPPEPPTQRNRYSEGLYTVILNTGTAFWYKTGDMPADCKKL